MADEPVSRQPHSDKSPPSTSLPAVCEKGGEGVRSRSFLRRWRTVIVGVAALALSGAVAVFLLRPSPIPEPPLPDLSGADEEVAEVIQEAREDVLRERSSSSAWGHLGEVLLAHTFNQEANRCFRQAELLDPREPAWPYLQGVNLVPHDPEAGLPCLERAVSRWEPGRFGPRLFLAEVLLERGRLDEGQSVLEQVQQTHPHDARLRLGLGRLALLRQQWKVGISHLEACQSDPHTRKRAHALLGEAWSQLGDSERAGVEQRRAAELPADRPWPDPVYEKVLKVQKGLRPRLQSVDFLARAGRVREAADLLSQTQERYPRSVEAWVRSGDFWFRLKRLDRAQECLRQAVQLDPDSAEAWFRLGTAQALVHSREAATSFRHAIRLKPNYAQAHYNLGQCLKEHGDRDAAAEEFREALRCSPDYDLARNALKELEAGSKQGKNL
jgi:tetratricopeptide (TPR) repeat protein